MANALIAGSVTPAATVVPTPPLLKLRLKAMAAPEPQPQPAQPAQPRPAEAAPAQALPPEPAMKAPDLVTEAGGRKKVAVAHPTSPADPVPTVRVPPETAAPGPVQAEPMPLPPVRKKAAMPEPPALPPEAAKPVEPEVPEPQATQTAALPPARTAPAAGDTGRQSATTVHEASYRHQVPPVYPRRALEMGQQGIVVLHAEVAPTGRPLNLKVAHSSGHRLLDAAALAAVRKWEFEPRKEDGALTTSWVRVPVRFVIKH